VWCVCRDINRSFYKVLNFSSIHFSLTVYWHQKQPANTSISCLSHTIHIIPDFSWHKALLSVWNSLYQQKSSIMFYHSQNCVRGCFLELCFVGCFVWNNCENKSLHICICLCMYMYVYVSRVHKFWAPGCRGDYIVYDGANSCGDSHYGTCFTSPLLCL